MNFVKQIGAEMKNMIRSKFIIISAIVIFAFITVVPPVFELIINAINDSYNTGVYYSTGYYDYSMDAYGEYNQITSELEYLNSLSEYMDQNLDGEALTLAEDYVEVLVEFYEKYASLVEGDSYITEMVWDMDTYLSENYILSLNGDYDKDELKQAISFVRWHEEFIDEIEEMTDAEKQAIVDRNTQVLDAYDELILNNDFSKYVDIQKILMQERIEGYESQIEALETSIIENPDNEEAFSLEIESLYTRIENINEIDIPMLEYRLERNIIPGDGSWEDTAIRDMESARYDVGYYGNPVTEEQYDEDQWLTDQYETYEQYVSAQEVLLQEAQFRLLVAENSLDSGKPDMSFVHDGARTKTQSTLASSMFISIFGILVGGWAIANEFQSGTIRLLMIRPRVREKVYISRFIAGLVFTYILFFIVFIVNTLLNGILYGFADYSYPNYTASGEVNFFLMLLGEIFATSTSLIFFFTLSFFASAIFKNMAVAIIVPTLCLVAGSILMGFLSQLPLVQFLSFTPVPYISMENFFLESSGYTIDYLKEKGMMLSAGLGAIVLIVYSGILFVTSLLAFKKQDITN